MYVTILDTETGETRESTYPSTLFWWSDGNGGCDCNRALLFGEEVDSEHRRKLGIDDDNCLGSRRFLAVNLRDPEPSILTKNDLLHEINSWYDQALRQKFMLP
jgi:hypothetical protein